jgi:hypothetical protein
MASGDRVVIVSYSGPNTVTATIDVANLFANTNVPIAANTLTLKEKVTPANSAITTGQGHIWFDDNFIYCATSNNVVKRAALSTF